MTRNVLAVGLLCAACCAAGYVRGFGIAETRGRALLAEQAEASASEREALAVAAAEAERLARQRLEAETERPPPLPGNFPKPATALPPNGRRSRGGWTVLPKMLPAIALACLLAGCACTTKPLVLPPPPPKLLPLPPELARLPEAPPPLAPGYGREHP